MCYLPSSWVVHLFSWNRMVWRSDSWSNLLANLQEEPVASKELCNDIEQDLPKSSSVPFPTLHMPLLVPSGSNWKCKYSFSHASLGKRYCPPGIYSIHSSHDGYPNQHHSRPWHPWIWSIINHAMPNYLLFMGLPVPCPGSSCLAPCPEKLSAMATIRSTLLCFAFPKISSGKRTVLLESNSCLM